MGTHSIPATVVSGYGQLIGQRDVNIEEKKGERIGTITCSTSSMSMFGKYLLETDFHPTEHGNT
jgi:hypothetical protein